MMLGDSVLQRAFQRALAAAEEHRGATAPNPPVGALALDASGRELSVQAHEGAGTPHAEARVLEHCRALGRVEQIHTLVVTLEPCNHHGRTPPCADAILSAGVRRVAYAVPDPNPKVAGFGAAKLREHGVETYCLADRAPGSPELARSTRLIAPFKKWVSSGLPWVTIKQALDEDGSMIPPQGQKTFTRESSLRFAHELRKRADAVMTGSGTILADLPRLDVRHVVDHPEKRRWLLILDRRGRVPRSYVAAAEERGFQVRIESDIPKALEFLGSHACHEVLVEAGPALLESVIRGGFWDSHVVIKRGKHRDEITETLRSE